MKLDIDTATAKEFINRSGENRKMAKTILETIRDVLRSISEHFTKNKLTREQLQMQRQLEKAERLWAEALGEASVIAQKTEGKNENKKTAQTDGKKFSLKSFPNGKRYVTLEVDQKRFDGMTTTEMIDEAKDIFTKRYQGHVIGETNKAFVNSDSKNHYTHPAKYEDEDLFQTKMRASPELSEILDSADGFRWNEDDGRHKDAVNGWRHYDVIFQMGSRWFSGDISVKGIRKGWLFYDMTKIKEIAESDLTQYGHVPDGQSSSNSFNTSLSQNGPVSNGNAAQNSGKKSIKATADLVEKYGAIPRGEKAARDIRFPKQTNDDTRVRRFARTAAEASVLTDEQAGAIEQAVLDGVFDYEPIGDQYAVERAEVKILRDAEQAKRDWAAVVNSNNRITKDDIALGELLLKQAADSVHWRIY